MEGQKRERPRQYTHVDPLEERPLPRVGFTPHNRNGADALKGEDVEDHESDGNQRGINWTAVRAFLSLQRFGEAVHAGFVLLGFADVVDGGHSADKNFARGERGDNSDAHLPIKSEGRDDGLNGPTETAGEALAEFCASFFVVEGGQSVEGRGRSVECGGLRGGDGGRGYLLGRLSNGSAARGKILRDLFVVRVGREEPEEDVDAEDDSASATKKETGAIPHVADDHTE